MYLTRNETDALNISLDTNSKRNSYAAYAWPMNAHVVYAQSEKSAKKNASRRRQTSAVITRFTSCLKKSSKTKVRKTEVTE